MKNKLERMVVLTANRPRHQYYAQTLYDSFNSVAGVFIEDKKVQEKVRDSLDETSPIVKNHLDDFKEKEKEFFGIKLDIPSSKLHYTVNINQVAREIKEIEPDIITVFGTTLIKEPLISACSKIVNLHLGLSPYYRGNGTNLFCFYNKELEYIGATVHFLDKKIDGGMIISQVRPDIDTGKDTINTINCKAIKRGIEEVVRVVEILQDRAKVLSHKQNLSIGRVYKSEDFTEEVCKTAYENVEKGLIGNYKPKEVRIYTLK
ncbi:MAG: formyltransferase family protein [archaeon]